MDPWAAYEFADIHGVATIAVAILWPYTVLI
jgi:hypothetical protein